MFVESSECNISELGVFSLARIGRVLPVTGERRGGLNTLIETNGDRWSVNSVS